MKGKIEKSIVLVNEIGKHRCLACGTTQNMSRRRYCSLACRQRLKYKLNLRTGLMKALHIRYATFYFSDVMIIMDMLPHGSKEVFSFVYPRSAGKKPADDFSKMANALGDIWWSSVRRTNKHYIASRHVLERANNKKTSPVSVKPMNLKKPNVREKSLLHLQLGRADLYETELDKVIKKAYRRLAKLHHPDLGGNATTFHNIHQAYEELSYWASNPTFVRQRGFVDKWFYDGEKENWVQPTPLPRSEKKRSTTFSSKKETASRPF